MTGASDRWRAAYLVRILQDGEDEEEGEEEKEQEGEEEEEEGRCPVSFTARECLHSTLLFCVLRAVKNAH